jgi:hypothetical protein
MAESPVAHQPSPPLIPRLQTGCFQSVARETFRDPRSISPTAGGAQTERSPTRYSARPPATGTLRMATMSPHHNPFNKGPGRGRRYEYAAFWKGGGESSKAALKDAGAVMTSLPEVLSKRHYSTGLTLLEINKRLSANVERTMQQLFPSPRRAVTAPALPGLASPGSASPQSVGSSVGDRSPPLPSPPVGWSPNSAASRNLYVPHRIVTAQKTHRSNTIRDEYGRCLFGEVL